MKIALTGTHSTGKTTLFNILKKDKYLKENFVFEEEVVREVNHKYNLPINEQGNELTQLIVSLEMFLINLKKENIISDRSMLDVLCYSKYLKDKNLINQECLDKVELIFNNSIYDLFIYIPPLIDLEKDGVRSGNIEFREEVEKNFKYYIKKYNLENILYLNEKDLNKRINIIYKEFDKKGIKHENM